jgi:hypothetical protein
LKDRELPECRYFCRLLAALAVLRWKLPVSEVIDARLSPDP